MLIPENVPAELKRYAQWVYWRSIQYRSGKPGKVPHTRCGKKAKVNDPSGWHTWEHVQDWKRKGFEGISFILTEDDPFVMLDLDQCATPADAAWDQILINDFGLKVLGYFNSYSEYSPSGTGVRIIVEGDIPRAIKRDTRGKDNTKPNIEVYSKLRAMTITGNVVPEFCNSIQNRQRELDKLCAKYLPKPKVYDRPFRTNGKFTPPADLPSYGENSGRNQKLATIAGILKKKDMSHGERLEWLYVCNSKLGVPLDEAEVRETVERLLK